MKRIIIITLALVLFIVPALAETDLSGMTFDELRELQTRITKELTNRPEWKSVPVPPGIYKVGVDIPAGEWAITCGESMFYYVNVECGEKTNETGTRIKPGNGWQFSTMICQPGTGEGKNPESLTVILTEGQYIYIQYGQAVFSTPERVDLGF
jgi:hypothetical protein